AVTWLKQVQQPGGGWGESCASYDDPSLAGRGTPTASQTAWALLALHAAGETDSPAARAGAGYLVATQADGGGWREEPFTGTGFRKVFYLKYHMYSLYFPLMALARYLKGMNRQERQERQDRTRREDENNGERPTRAGRGRPRRVPVIVLPLSGLGAL